MQNDNREGSHSKAIGPLSRVSMWLARWWGLAILASRAGAETPNVVEIPDHGRIGRFEIALDEIHRPKAAAPEAIPGRKGIEDLRQYLAERRTKSGSGWELVLYKPGEARTAESRRYMGNELAVHLKDGKTTNDIAGLDGVAAIRPFASLPGWHIVSGRDPLGALALHATLSQHPAVALAEPLLARQAHKKLIPSDRFFPQQWHLRNTGQSGGIAGTDIHVTNVWNTWRGKGVHVAIVDDGLQYTHPDLAAGYDPAYSYDFNGGDLDPYPNTAAGDSHGTAVTGIVGARANNGRGVAGVAYECILSGIRLVALPSTDEEEAGAMLRSNSVIQIKNNSWGAEDCPSLGTALEGPGPLAKAAMQEGVLSGRGGLGEIYVWASGNGGDCDEDVNYDGYANSIEVISVGAVDYQGHALSYNEHGACVLVSAPTGDFGLLQIVTTDLVGEDGNNYTGAPGELPDRDYTENFNGTSASCPMVSGVAALMLQASPGLGWRDVQEILLRSSHKVQPQDSGWQTNSAGVPHHYLLGAGLVDAEAAVKLATNWANLGPVASLAHSITGLSTTITPAGLTNEFVFDAPGFRMEHATVTLTTTHPNWGDLDVTLISPSGYQSRLARAHTADASTDYKGWVLSSVRHWGEKAAGTWKVRIADAVAGNIGVLNSVEVTLYGSQPVPRLAIDVQAVQPVLMLQAAADGWTYNLEVSEDLQQWTPLGQVTIPGSGSVPFTDAAGTGQKTRFYRARLL